MSGQNELIIEDYLNKDIPCKCGKEHSVPIKYIHIGDKALDFLPTILTSNCFHKPFFLYDSTTIQVAGSEISRRMEQNSLAYQRYILPEQEPVPDENTLGKILINLDASCDILIGVGSGTINDLCRFISYKLRIPYMIITTAPSMDGYASNVAPLIVNHMKTTYEAHVPFAILGDTALLKDAPMKMIAAGIGDILGKYTCLCDWEIAHTITGEYHCKMIEDLVRKSLTTVVSYIPEAESKNPKAMISIMDALVLSGIAMSFAGNSRPASGSEHHLSHYWEMMFLFKGMPPILHGTKLGIGTIAVLKAYELLMSREINFERAATHAKGYSASDWEAFMKKAYLDAADSVIELERRSRKNSPENVLFRLQLLKKNWDRIKEITEKLPSADTVSRYLSRLGAPIAPMTVGIDKETFINGFLAAKELRNRFGLLQILYDLGLSREIAEEVWDYFENR